MAELQDKLQEADQLVQKLSNGANIIIATDTQLERANNVLVYASKTRKQLEEQRRHFTSDLVAQKKKIDEAFKERSEPIEKLEKKLKGMMQDYYKKQEDEAKKKQEKAKESDDMAIVEAPKKSIKNEKGTTSFKKVWTFEIEDLDKIPSEFWVVDEKKIHKAVTQGGRREIPGVKVYQEVQTSVR